MSSAEDHLGERTGLAAGRPSRRLARLMADGRLPYVARRIAVGGVLALGDALAIWLAASFALGLGALAGALPSAAAGHLPLHGLLLIFLASGLYAGSALSPFERFRARARAIVLFAALDAVLVGASAPRLAETALVALLVLVLGYYLEIATRRLLIRHRLWAAPAAIVGCGDAARRLHKLMADDPDGGLQPVGFIRSPQDPPLAREALPDRLIGDVESLERLNGRIEIAVLTSRADLDRISAATRFRPPVELLLVEGAEGLAAFAARTRPVGGDIGIALERDPIFCQNRHVKRALDLAIALPAAILSLPVVACLALMVMAVDRGSPFYVQTRVGRRGRPIRVPKLKTMYSDAENRLEAHLASSPTAREEWERYFKLRNDPRILPWVGNLLRRSSLDELPQLWCVITGDMSLVGPRPFPDYHVKRFDAEFQAVRSGVMPGLTGLWQVRSRSNGDLTVQRDEDLLYIRNWSVWLDLFILLETPPAVLKGSGAR